VQPGRLLRISVGIEAPEDLLQDLRAGLDRAFQQANTFGRRSGRTVRASGTNLRH
jgi:hypothetical protein